MTLPIDESNRERFTSGVVLLLFCAFLATVPCLVSIKNTDFNKAYYAAAAEIRDTGSFHYSYTGLKSLPIVAGLFVPFAAFERAPAARAFLAVELVAYLAAFAVALRFLARSNRERWALLFLFVACRAFFICVRLGQLTPLCLLLLVSAFVAFDRGWKATCGGLLAAAFALKIPAGLLVLFFLLAGEVRTVGGAALSFAAIVTASLVLFGVPLHAEYFERVILENAGTTLTAYNNTSLSGTAVRVFEALQPDTADGLFRWATVPIPAAVGAFVAVATSFLLAGLSWLLWRGPRAAWALGFSIVLCASLVIFPVVWDHYYVFALIPFFVVFRNASAQGGANVAQWAGIGAAFALVNFPLMGAVQALSGDPELRLLRSLVPATPLVGILCILTVMIAQYRKFESTGIAPRKGGESRVGG